MKLDAINKRILDILQEQGAITNAELASQIGLAPASVFERVRKLEAGGIIRKYVALVDREKIGKGITAFVFLTVSDYSAKAIQKLSAEIGELPEVLECYRLGGEQDYLLKVVTDDIPSYDRFICDKLSTLSALGKFSSMFVLSTIKEQTKISLEVNP